MIAYLLEQEHDGEEEYQRRNIDERGLIGAPTRFWRGSGRDRRRPAGVGFMVFEYDAGGCFLKQILIGVWFHGVILLPPRERTSTKVPRCQKDLSGAGGLV